MRVNIRVEFDLVEEIDASDHSVDQAELAASGMSPDEIAGALVDSIQARAAKVRGQGKARPQPDPSTPGDYPVDPDQD